MPRDPPFLPEPSRVSWYRPRFLPLFSTRISDHGVSAYYKKVRSQIGIFLLHWKGDDCPLFLFCGSSIISPFFFRRIRAFLPLFSRTGLQGSHGSTLLEWRWSTTATFLEGQDQVRVLLFPFAASAALSSGTTASAPSFSCSCLSQDGAGISSFFSERYDDAICLLKGRTP